MIQLIVLQILLSSSLASTITSQIAGIDLAKDESKPNLVFLLKDGLVGKLPVRNSKMLNLLTEGTKNHRIFEISMDQDRFIKSAKVVGQATTEPSNEMGYPFYVYSPTVLPDMDAANTIFNELNPYWRRRAECYNKAHVWAYEENKKRDINLMKVFLFFTSKYIWDYNWNWWFHVSPFVLVNESGKVTENVIDYTFMKGPTKMHDWTNYFIIPKTECPTVEKYSDYDQHQQESYCYLIKKSMYFWQPKDIENYEKTGVEKTSFLKEEVDTAYWQGF